MIDTDPLATRQEALSKCFEQATESASDSMRQWTNGAITLTLDEVREVSFEDIPEVVDIGDELLTMVVLTLEGESGGQLILTFDEENGRQLAGTLLNRKVNQEPEWSDLEKSALNETGNILGCAYLNALTSLIEPELVPSPPYFIQDFGASVLEQAIMAQAMVSDSALVCRTTFHRKGEDLNWNVFFVPTKALLNNLEKAFVE